MKGSWRNKDWNVFSECLSKGLKLHFTWQTGCSMLNCHHEMPLFLKMFTHHIVNDSRSIEAAAIPKTKRRPLLPVALPGFLIWRPVWCLPQHCYYVSDMQTLSSARLDHMLNGETQLGRSGATLSLFLLGEKKNKKKTSKKQAKETTHVLGNDVELLKLGSLRCLGFGK